MRSANCKRCPEHVYEPGRGIAMARTFKADQVQTREQKFRVELPNMQTDMICPECGGAMALKKVPSIDRPFYGCVNWPTCKVTHGAHPDGRPMGKPADDATRAARHETHQVFDALWLNAQDRRTARKIAYLWLQEELEFSPDDCHIGEFDLVTCERVQRACGSAELDDVFSPERIERATGGSSGKE